MTMTPAVEAELGKNHFVQVVAVKVELPTTTARFFLGRGEMLINGETYYGAGVAGEDSIFGQIDAIEGRTNEEAPRMRMQIAGLASTIGAEVREYEAQGSLVTVLYAVLDPVTYAVIADPEVVFYGFLDAVEPEVGETAVITCEVGSAMEWLFRADEASRRNDRSHQAIFPGELGYQFVLDTVRPLPWGEASAAAPTYYGTADSLGRNLTYGEVNVSANPD